ncbi:(2Fe-2S)-binding protein [Paraburkholderia sp. Ac-20336]|nr:(2Fe-2S)-binding protein [Paraburkholderia sp. Ac-20336]NIF80690.1 (2Fe-2S)-binding protein [Paraburkholderia sp. Cy-641]
MSLLWVLCCDLGMAGSKFCCGLAIRGARASCNADIDAAMTPVVCRCGTYPRVRAAIHLAARRMG